MPTTPLSAPAMPAAPERPLSESMRAANAKKITHLHPTACDVRVLCGAWDGRIFRQRMSFADLSGTAAETRAQSARAVECFPRNAHVPHTHRYSLLETALEVSCARNTRSPLHPARLGGRGGNAHKTDEPGRRVGATDTPAPKREVVVCALRAPLAPVARRATVPQTGLHVSAAMISDGAMLIATSEHHLIAMCVILESSGLGRW